MVTFEIKQKVFIIQIEGDILTQAVEELKKTFQESWDRKIFKLAIDLGKSNLINSSGIGLIIGALKTCRDSSAEGDLVIVNPPYNIRRTLRIMGIDQFVPAKDNLKDAIDYLHSPKVPGKRQTSFF